VAALLASVALTGLAAGHGGIYPTLALPGPVSRIVLAPALAAAFFVFVRRPRWGRG
jgi:hypothetical protein